VAVAVGVWTPWGIAPPVPASQLPEAAQSQTPPTLEQTWADIRRHTSELPEVVGVTGTGLSSSAVHIDAKWGHFGADHWVEGRPTEQGQGAALDLSAAPRKPELFVAGECLAEGPRQTLQTILHEAVHALAHVRRSRTPLGAASSTTSARSSPSPASSA
jgi:hypothetical protein